MVGDDRKSIVNSVLRACSVLETLAYHGPDMPLASVAAAVGLNRPTAHRILATLVEAGWVRRDAGRYSLTMKAFAVGAAASREASLQARARPAMLRLAAGTEATAYLYAPFEGKALCIDRVEASHPVRVHHVSVGDSIPITSGAAPLALAACRPDLLGDEAAGNVDPEQLSAQLAEARELGYVVRRDDLYPGITAIGAPIFDAAATAVGAIGIAGTSDRYQGAHLDQAVAMVTSAAASVSADLGSRPTSP